MNTGIQTVWSPATATRPRAAPVELAAAVLVSVPLALPPVISLPEMGMGEGTPEPVKEKDDVGRSEMEESVPPGLPVASVVIALPPAGLVGVEADEVVGPPELA